MHLAKVILLLLLTLLVMRLVSWAAGWVISRLFHRDGRGARLGANLAGLGLFTGLLIIDRMPGEIFDSSAFIFGIVVFTSWAALDLKWWPWAPRQPRDTATTQPRRR